MGQLSKEQRNLLERATLQYAEYLDEAEEWLASRGIGMEYARSNGLGVVRNPIAQHRHLEGRLCIPYLTDFGPVALNFRCLQRHNCKQVSDHQKYRKPKGTETRLYHVQSIDDAEEWIAITEGEVDALTLNMIGIPAVGIPGAENWEPHWNNVFEDFSRVYVFEDGDGAGKDLWDNASNSLGHIAIRVKMPDGEDVNSVYTSQGKHSLLSRIVK